MARGETYEEFVGKFDRYHAKSTDDCYTPNEIYEVVLDWCMEHLHIVDRPVVRPFYPGGDFENFEYPENCVVVDNPPFSIFSKIFNWYNERGIDFFLFAPSLMSIRRGVTFVSVDAGIIYQNGAIVNTAFVTNMMGDLLAITAPDLSAKISETTRKLHNITTFKKYSYPKNVLRASTLNTLARRGIHFSVSASEGTIVRKTTTKKREDFGNSIILCDRKRKELEDALLIPFESEKIEIELNEHSKDEIERINALDRINNPQSYD